MSVRVGRVDLDVVPRAGATGRRSCRAPRPGSGVFDSAPNSLITSTLPGNVRSIAASRARIARRELRGAVVRRRRTSPSSRSRRPRRRSSRASPACSGGWSAPHVDRDQAGRGRWRAASAVESLHVAAPPRRRGRCRRPRRRGSRRRSTGAARSASTAVRACCSASREQVAACRVPVARAFDRADALPDEDPRRVQPFEQCRVERVLRAHRVGADRLQLGDDPVLVARRERVAVAGRRPPGCVAPWSSRRCAVEVAGRPRVPGELAQADPRRVAALARHARVPAGRGSGSAGDHSAGAATVRGRGRGRVLRRGRAATRAKASGIGLAGPVPASPAATIVRAAPSLCTWTLTGTSPARGSGRPSVVAIVGADSSLAPIGRSVHLAVEPAPVEPRAVEAFVGLPVRVAPVDPHDAPCGCRRASVRRSSNGQVGAAVRAERAGRRGTLSAR